MRKTTIARLIKYAILRDTYFNGTLIERRNLIEVFDDEEHAKTIAGTFQKAVFLPVPLCGFSFNFYVKDV